MKKYLKLLFVLLLVFMIFPVVHAEELPETGVTYFMMYPDGHEEVTESYAEATHPEEELLFTATTDAYGKVYLCDLQDGGELRVVQKVPAGYTTKVTEQRLTLPITGNVSFVDYRSGNPKTARTFFILLGLGAVIGVTIVVSRKHKKSLLIIPVVLGMVGVTVVKAFDNCPCIQIVDDNGNPLKDVVVEVYGTPVVTAGPAVKFSANGGHFFDGKTVMYFRLPSTSCSVDEFLNSLTDEQRSYFYDNVDLAYRMGYYADGFDYPDMLSNGTVVDMMWDYGSVEYLMIHGNGGVLPFYGQELATVTVLNTDYLPRGFINNDEYFIGVDDNAACSHYGSNGLVRDHLGQIVDKSVNAPAELYACWNSKPDGIYVNGELFLGNPDSCLSESDGFSPTGDELYLSNYEYGLFFGDTDNTDVLYFAFYPTLSDAGHGGEVFARYSETLAKGVVGNIPITSIEIVQNGQTILYAGANELESDGMNQYTILNDNKMAILVHYMSQLNQDYCDSASID